jgi:hypothetical protein
MVRGLFYRPDRSANAAVLSRRKTWSMYVLIFKLGLIKWWKSTAIFLANVLVKIVFFKMLTNVISFHKIKLFIFFDLFIEALKYISDNWKLIARNQIHICLQIFWLTWRAGPLFFLINLNQNANRVKNAM